MSAISSAFSSLAQNGATSNLEDALMNDIGQQLQQGNTGGNLTQEMNLLTALLNQSNGSGNSTNPDGSSGCEHHHHHHGLHKAEQKLEGALEQNLNQQLQQGQTPSTQEMNLLTELLNQGQSQSPSMFC